MTQTFYQRIHEALMKQNIGEAVGKSVELFLMFPVPKETGYTPSPISSTYSIKVNC